jgi:hypothetical protein
LNHIYIAAEDPFEAEIFGRGYAGLSAFSVCRLSMKLVYSYPVNMLVMVMVAVSFILE